MFVLSSGLITSFNMVKMFGGHLQCCEEDEGVSFWFTIPLECVDTVPPSPSIMMRKQLTVTPDITDQSISYPSYMNDDDNMDPITDANASNASTFSSAFSSSHNIFSSSSTSSSFSPTSQVYQNAFHCPSPTHAFPSSSSASSRDGSPFSRTDHTPVDHGLSGLSGSNRGRGIRVDVGNNDEGHKEVEGERGRELDVERGRERGREGREVGSCFESPPKGSQFQSNIYRSCSSTNSEKTSRKINPNDRDRDMEKEKEKEREREKEKNKRSPRLRILIVDDSSICQKVCHYFYSSTFFFILLFIFIFSCSSQAIFILFIFCFTIFSFIFFYFFLRLRGDSLPSIFDFLHFLFLTHFILN